MEADQANMYGDPDYLSQNLTAATRARSRAPAASADQGSAVHVTLRCRITMHAAEHSEHPDLPQRVGSVPCGERRTRVTSRLLEDHRA